MADIASLPTLGVNIQLLNLTQAQAGLASLGVTGEAAGRQAAAGINALDTPLGRMISQGQALQAQIEGVGTQTGIQQQAVQASALADAFDRMRASASAAQSASAAASQQSQASSMAAQIAQLDPFQKGAIAAKAAQTELNTTVAAGTVAFDAATLGTGRIRQGLVSLIAQMTGTIPVLDRIVLMFASMGAESVTVLGALAGVALLGLAYEQLTASSRAAAEAQQKSAEALDALVGKNPFGDIPKQIADVNAQLVGLRKTLASVHGDDWSLGAQSGNVAPQGLNAATDAVNKAQLEIDAAQREMDRLHAAEALGFTEPVAEAKDALDKQLALNAAYGQSALTLSIVAAREDDIAKVRKINTGTVYAVNAALVDYANRLSAAEIAALKLADAQKMASEASSRNVSLIGSEASNAAALTAARDQLEAVGLTGTALAKNQVAAQEYAAVMAAAATHDQAVETANAANKAADDKARLAAALAYADQVEEGADKAAKGEAAYRDGVIDANAALARQAQLAADAATNTASVKAAQDQYDLITLSGTAAEHLKNTQDEQNALAAAQVEYQKAIVGAGADDAAFALARLNATKEMLDQVKAIKDATIDAAAAWAPWKSAIASVTDTVGQFAGDLFAKPRDAFADLVSAVQSMWGNLISDLVKQWEDSHLVPSITAFLSSRNTPENSPLTLVDAPGAALAGPASAAAGIPGWGLAVAGLVTAGSLLFGAGNAQAEAAKKLHDAADATAAAQSTKALLDYASPAGSVQQSLDQITAAFQKARQDLGQEFSDGSITSQRFGGQSQQNQDALNAAETRTATDFFASITSQLNAFQGPAGAYLNAQADIQKQFEQNKTDAIAAAGALAAAQDGATAASIAQAKANVDFTAITQLEAIALQHAKDAEIAAIDAINSGLAVRKAAALGDVDGAAAAQRRADEEAQLAQAEAAGWTADQIATLKQVQALEDVKTATDAATAAAKNYADAMEKSAQSFDSLMVRFLNATNQANAAAKLGQQASQQQELYGVTDPYQIYLIKYVQAAETTQLQQQQAAKEQTDALNAQSTTLQDSLSVQQQQLTTMQQLATSLATYAGSLNTGSLSPLSPTALLAATRDTRDTLYQQALGGDQTAASQFGAANDAFLTQDRSYNASNTTYASDFAQAQKEANDLAALYGTKATYEQQTVDLMTQQLAAMKAQIDAINATTTAVVNTPPPMTYDQWFAAQDYLKLNDVPTDPHHTLLNPDGSVVTDSVAVTVDFSPVTSAVKDTTGAVNKGSAAVVATVDEGNAALVTAIGALGDKLDALLTALNGPDNRSLV